MARRSARFTGKVCQQPVKPMIEVDEESCLSPLKKELKVKLYPLFESASGSMMQSKVLDTDVKLDTECKKLQNIENTYYKEHPSSIANNTCDQQDPNMKTKATLLKAPNEGLSEYERQIQENIEVRKRMFQMLISDAKQDLMTTILPPTDKSKSYRCHRGLKRKIDGYERTETPPLRMSLRSRGKLVPETNEEKIKNVTPVAKNQDNSSVAALTLTEAYVDQDSAKDARLLEDIIPLLKTGGELEKLPIDQQAFLKLIQTFTVQEEGVVKVTKSRIYSLDWHPNASKLLLAAGDRDGNIGFWDVDNVEDKHQGVRAFKVHSMPVNCLTFDKFNHTRLLSTSYDGYVCCLDFNSDKIDQVYSVKRTKDTWTAYHAQRDPSTILVSQANGDVMLVDVRAKPGRVQNLIQCFQLSARTLSLHPQDQNLFMVCNRFGEQGIFDLRYTTGNEDDLAAPVIAFPKSHKGINSAFFSPVTGQYALATCADDSVKIYNVQQGGAKPECVSSIHHNNFTGRWLTPFKAVWHPQREDVFVVGSMRQPRRIELFGALTGQLLHNFEGDWLSSICSINSFHPSISILAGGNASGRVHIFRS